MVLARLAFYLDITLHERAAEVALEGASEGYSAVNDVDTIRAFIASPLATALLDAPWSVGFIIAIFFLHPFLGCLAIIASVLMLLVGFLGHVLTDRTRSDASEITHKGSNLLRMASQNSDATATLGVRNRLVVRMTSLRVKGLHASLSAADRQTWIDAMSRGLRNLIQVCVLGLAAYLVVCHGLQTGAIVAGSMLFSRALNPVERLGAGCPSILAFIRSYRRAILLEKSICHQSRPMPLPPLKGALELDKVSFFIPAHKRLVLRQISLKVNPNELIVVVGREGAGKSTLSKVLAGALRPTSGCIRLDGSKIEDFDEGELGIQIGYAPQSFHFMSESVADFIARGTKLDSPDLVRAAELASVHEAIQRLPQGYNTDLTLNKHFISAGVRQRIILARAFYKSPKLLILDEPTSHLDDKGEMAFLNAIQSLKAVGSTIIVISRLPGLLHLADRLVMLDEGEVRAAADQNEMQSFITPRLASSRDL